MSPSLRQFGVLLAAAIPPLVAFAVLLLVAPDWADSVGLGTAVLVAAVAAIGWSAIVLLVAGRGLSGEVRAVVELAERGSAVPAEAPGDGSASPDAQRRTAAALDERNRQIAALAEDMAATSMGGTPAEVAAAVVATARAVTRDPTWQLVVLHVEEPDLLAAGVYDEHVRPTPAPLLDLHAWAAVAEPAAGSVAHGRSQYLVGPWGAMVSVDASAGTAARALLLAPWAGRADPSPSEMNLLALIGQHAAAAIDHALLYARLRTQTDELHRMASVQADFLRGITHDLQTPLTSIGATAAEMAASHGVDDAGRADLETIARQADRLRRMVGQLLVASRLDAGALVPRQDVFRVEPLVRRTWDALHDPNHVLVVHASGASHLAVGDPDRFEQVLWALFDNAVKYGPSSPEVVVSIEARPTDAGLESVITVADHGPGMDAATAALAFDQFFRAQNARESVPDGSGIGLYAARGLIEAMNGQISLDSAPGAGTSVAVVLPAEEVEAAGAEDPA
jgi:signal transduction histidine kinase